MKPISSAIKAVVAAGAVFAARLFHHAEAQAMARIFIGYANRSFRTSKLCLGTIAGTDAYYRGRMRRLRVAPLSDLQGRNALPAN